MFYSQFCLTGILDRISAIGQRSNGESEIVIWLFVVKPFFAGEKLHNEVLTIPVKIIGNHAKDWHRILSEGMELSIEGDIRSYDWLGKCKKSEQDVNFKVVSLVGQRIRLTDNVS